MTVDGEAMMAEPAYPVRPSLLRWLREGARALFFRRPQWDNLATGPALIALLVTLRLLVSIGVNRLFYDVGAVFNWQAVAAGWATLLLTVWACYVVRPFSACPPAISSAPSAAHLLTLILAASLVLSSVYGLLYAALVHSAWFAKIGQWGQLAAWLLPVTWTTLATLVLMLRTGERALLRRLTAACAVFLGCALSYYLAPAPSFWNEEEAAVTEEGSALSFDQELVEMQQPMLAEDIAALKAQRPGIADMYTITFAPFEGEEVFRRETRVVNEVMAKRFDAEGRGLQLINHAEEIERMVWATPVNLQRAIAGMAKTMDVNEDVLFIHLTSHGAQDGQLAANFQPLEVAPVTPEDLKRWLDEAGIKHRVISISACFAGNWVAPLAGDDTLVMTASDADHTSYGCGKKSDLTFFGRAMYDEQLRNKTLSFEEAHAAARRIIDQREKEAGKDDGYSNPQIKVGSRIRPYLDKMRSRLTR